MEINVKRKLKLNETVEQIEKPLGDLQQIFSSTPSTFTISNVLSIINKLNNLKKRIKTDVE